MKKAGAVTKRKKGGKILLVTVGPPHGGGKRE